jgi:hypothetical protein
LTLLFTPNDQANYNAVTVPKTINVARKLAFLSVDNATKVYGTDNPTFTGTVTGLLPQDEPFIGKSFVTQATKFSRANITYVISGALTDLVPTDRRSQL